MKNLPISLTLYTTTKGHFGYKDCIKHTVNHLKNVADGCFTSEFAHIKTCEGEEGEKVRQEMTSFLEGRKINVLSTTKDWNRKRNNHAIEYFADMETIMNNNDVHQNRFIFFHEDDWIINTDKKLIQLLQDGIKLLNENKEILCVRVNADIDKDTSKATKIGNDIFLQNENYTRYGPTITFQPTLMRTRDWYAAVRAINRSELRLTQHCELLTGYFMKSLFSDSMTPFAFFDPNVINATHIGSEEFAKENKNVIL